MLLYLQVESTNAGPLANNQRVSDCWLNLLQGIGNARTYASIDSEGVGNHQSRGSKIGAGSRYFFLLHTRSCARTSICAFVCTIIKLFIHPLHSV